MDDRQANPASGAKRGRTGDERTLRTLLANLPGMAYRCPNERHWPMTYVSEGCLALTGYTAEELASPGYPLYGDLIHPDDQKAVWQDVQAALAADGAFVLEYRLRDKAGEERWIWEKGRAVGSENGVAILEGFAEDITERKRAEEELRATEEQLRQSQRMESIGRLAGGVAHDFNNLLMVILATVDLIEEQLRDGDPLVDDVRQIGHSAERAADLTRQLLAFSRRQVLQPELIDLNRTLDGIDRMLHRVIGEDIRLTSVLAPDLWPVEADPGQLEQLLLNLAVNARDAMPEGGRLTMETTNVELDESYARRHRGVTPGPYVMLAVSDSGSGMDAETRERIFEPFFTTKEKGKGTGLGLSTVYGIVKQHGGNIWVYSEPNLGTTFEVYLPRATRSDHGVERPPEPRTDLHGTETVLVVEDEPGVLELAARVLSRKGYRVLQASDGRSAQTVAGAHDGPIHLLLTDVVMPHADGRTLSEALQKARPALRTLFMSGYTDDAIVRHGVLAPGVHFLQKPFTINTLSQKVREVLDCERR